MIRFAEGWDPGSERSGHGAVEITDAGRIRYVHGGHPELDPRKPAHRARLLAHMQIVKERGGLVAVETIQGGVYCGSKDWHNGAALIETARIEGYILMAAYQVGLEPIEIGAKDWMAAYCRTTFPSPKQIRIIVEGTVDDLPHFHHLDREHAHDGLAIASLVLAQHYRKQIIWPASVQRAVWEQQVAEKAAREAKSAKTKAAIAVGLPAEPKPRQWRTKKQRARISAGVRAARAR